MEDTLVQALVTIVTTLCGYTAVNKKLNQLLRDIGTLRNEHETVKTEVKELHEKVLVLKKTAHGH